jgi:hypothetical protein
MGAFRERVVEDFMAVCRKGLGLREIGKLSIEVVLRHSDLGSECLEVACEQKTGQWSKHTSPARGRGENGHRTESTEQTVTRPIVVKSTPNEMDGNSGGGQMSVVFLHGKRQQQETHRGSKRAEHLRKPKIDGEGDDRRDDVRRRVHQGPGKKCPKAPEGNFSVAEEQNQRSEQRELDPQVARNGHCRRTAPPTESDSKDQTCLGKRHIVDRGGPKGMGGREGEQCGQHPSCGFIEVFLGPPPSRGYGQQGGNQVEDDEAVRTGEQQPHNRVDFSEQGECAGAGLPGLPGECGEVIEFMAFEPVALDWHGHQPDN